MIPLQVYQIALIVGAVVIGAVVLYAVIAVLGSLLRLAIGSGEEEPTLLEQVNAARPPRTWFGATDRDFDRMVRGTMFGVTTDRAIEWILLGAAIVAAAAYIATFSLELALVGLMLGAGLVLLIFYVSRHRWKRAIQEQLPDACFQLARCLRAGLSLPSGIRETSEYIGEPVASIFRKGAKWMENGLSVSDSMRKLADDVRLTDFDTLTEVVSIQEEYGGNLPTMLDRLAVAIRDRNQFRGYYRSVTALGRLTALFVALAAPVAALALWIFQPLLFNNFFTSPLGTWLLVAAAVLEFLGIVWLLWLLSGWDEY